MLSVRSIVVVAAAGILAGCSAASSQSTMNPSTTAGAQQGTSAQQRAHGILSALPNFAAPASVIRGKSWMSPDAKKSSLLYVADEAAGVVDVFSYPQGKPEGTLSGGFNAPSAVCTNKAGDVYIANGNSMSVDVYAHGGTSPLRVLTLPGFPELSCSVDQKSGDFAIGALLSAGGSEIAVFKGGAGTPKIYAPPNQYGLPGCAYDPKGNLYCDAYPNSEDNYLLFELPKNKSTLSTVTVSGAGGLEAGPMQWDGKGLAFGPGAQSTIYQIGLTKSGGSITGSTVLNGAGDVWQFWIDGKRLVGPTYGGSAGSIVGYFKYPVGGSPTKTITGFSQPGAAVSTAKSQ
jgi:hypothetical protein